MAGADIDFGKLEHSVERCCKTTSECGNCDKLHCLVGFARTVAKYGLDKGLAQVPGGAQLLPRDDYRTFYEEDVATALAETLRQCKNCRDNHDEDCSVSLIRSALEQALLGDKIEYTGSVLTYLMALQRINPKVGQKVAAGYREGAA